MSKWKTSNGPLQWTHVSGKGAPKYGKQYTSEDPADFEYKATRIVTAEEAKVIQAEINEFWKANKPAKIAKPSSTFLKPILEATNEKDEYGEPIKKESGKYSVTASTNASFKGKEGYVSTKIVLLRGNGTEIPANHPLVVGTVGVGEGSEGIIHGSLAVTEYEGKAYVKFYLKGVQFSKFVPYEGSGVEADDIGVTDDGFDTDGLDVEPVTGPQL